jgi:hypothetical protein
LNRYELSLAARRRALVERSAAQRAALSVYAEPLVRKTAAFDRVVDYVRRNPVVSSVAVGTIALLGPRRLWDMAIRAVTLYTLLKK